ncbi:MAG TPA: SUMF1/EgtB/PvdO family nonheme iron enzyme [Nannocystaceae bacterium]|nr:SUMF1/EgtB/PvdO family nonheme iron enzyme [Nannocystaceae bacterium]
MATLPDGTVIAPCLDPAPLGMACIPGGAFVRGTDDGPDNTRPKATIWLQTFYMDLDEVTYEAYSACKKEKKCLRGGPLYNDFSRPLQPITGISWFAAVKFCELAGKHLPTEAQWEKAARGPDGELYPWGDDPVTCERAIIKDERGRSCGVKKKREHPDNGRTFEIGSRPAYRYGLRDMIGNAWEWVYDWSSKDWARCGDACSGIDPKGPCGGALQCRGHTTRIVRGGSWYWDASYATGAYRRTHVPANPIENFHHFGFRCAASVDEAKALASAPAGDG